MLKNGNDFSLKSYLIEVKYYTITNTCAFDSITQMFATAFADSYQYSEFIKKNSNEIFFEIITKTLKDGINV